MNKPNTGYQERASSTGSLFIAFVLVVCIRVLFALYTRLTYEDALITMRYAENLVAGHGFVYNLGERVLGTTTPFFTLLLVLGAKLGVDTVLFGRMLGILADGISAVFIYRFVERWGGGVRAARYAIILFSIWGVVVRVSVSGMETSVVVLLMLATLYALLRRRHWLAGVLAGLLLWTRVDALCWLGVVYALYCISQRRIVWQSVVSCVAVLAPWVIFATIYFGSPLPHSIVAKMAAYGGDTGVTMGQTAANVFGAFLGNGISEIGLRGMPLVLYIVGCVVVARRYRELLALALFPMVHLSAMVIMRVLMFDWYYVPAMVPYLIVAAICADELNRKVESVMPRVRNIGPVIVLLACGLYLAHHAGSMREFQRQEELRFKRLGLWLADHTPVDARVQLEPIGYIGYYSGRYVVDEIGLVSPEVTAYRAQNPGAFAGVPSFAPLSQHFSPDVVVVRAVQLRPAFDAMKGFEPWFKRNYKQVASFTASADRLGTPDDLMLVFRRTTSSD